jgi:tRNA nucleotidyltransferase (CCA-adding enzyme)
MRLFSTLPGELISLMRGMGEAADSINAKAYLIGAYPRSILIREDCSDLEVVVTGDSQKMVEQFSSTYSTIKTKKIHTDGRFTVVPSPYNKGDFIRVARARQDEKGGVGDILSESLARGFSVDSLAISLSGTDFGEVVDPAGAAGDIMIKTLRILHRNTFEQDPRFIFKALYYTARYNLSWDPMTKTLWGHALKNGTHLKLSPSEIKEEIKLIKKEKNGKSALKLLEVYNIKGDRGMFWKKR